MKNQINRVGYEFSIGHAEGLRKPACAQRSRAFTVLELVGVLAILAIMAAAVIPNVIRRIDQAALDREKSDLSTMADRFVQSVVTDKIIPAVANIPAAIATYSDVTANQISTNLRGFRRRFMADPSLSLPYAQGGTGLPSPLANPRFLILTTIAGNSVTALNNITASFSTIWNSTNGLPLQGWTGKPEDLWVQRIDLGPLFHKVVLINIDTINDGFYALEINTPGNVQHGGSQFTAYVLDGTALNLFEFGSAIPTNLQVRVIVRKDESLVYQNNRWARSLSSDQLTQTIEPQSFAWWVQQFLLPPAREAFPPDRAQFNATQQSVIDEMYTFMSSYVLWATGDPNHNPPILPFEGSGSQNAPQFPYYSVLPDSRTRLYHFSGNLIQP